MSSKTCMYLKEKKNVIFTSSVNNTLKGRSENIRSSNSVYLVPWLHSSGSDGY